MLNGNIKNDDNLLQDDRGFSFILLFFIHSSFFYIIKYIRKYDFTNSVVCCLNLLPQTVELVNCFLTRCVREQFLLKGILLRVYLLRSIKV